MTAVRTRSVPGTIKEYNTRHLKMRQKQVEAGEFLNADKIEADAQHYLEIGQGLMDVVQKLRKMKPPVEQPKTEEEAIREQIKALQDKLEKKPEVVAKRGPGRPRKNAA